MDLYEDIIRNTGTKESGRKSVFFLALGLLFIALPIGGWVTMVLWRWFGTPAFGITLDFRQSLGIYFILVW